MNSFFQILRGIPLLAIPNRGSLSREQLLHESNYPNGLCAICLFLFFICIFMHTFYGFSETGLRIVYAVNIGIDTGVITALLMWRITGSKVFSFNILLLTATGLTIVCSSFLGGTLAPTTVVFCLIPISAVIVCGDRIGAFWAIICISSLFIIAYLDSTTNIIEQIIPATRFGIATAFTWASIILVATSATVFYHTKMLQAQSLLKEKKL